MLNRAGHVTKFRASASFNPKFTMKNFALAVLSVVALAFGAFSAVAADMTGTNSALYAGFVLQPLKYEVQHPYDLKLEDRYSYDKTTDTHDLWVLDTDKPHAPPPNKTEARTEMHILDANYKPGSGLHMMDCDMFIVPGTFACISQVFGTGPMAMIIADTNGTISDLRTHAVIGRDMNGKWFHWTIIHDPSATGPGAIKVYIDGKLASDKVSGSKEKSFYFKVGVYSRKNSNHNEIKVRNLKYFIKPPAPIKTG